MFWRRHRFLVPVFVLVVAAGCGGDDSTEPVDRPAATDAEAPATEPAQPSASMTPEPESRPVSTGATTDTPTVSGADLGAWSMVLVDEPDTTKVGSALEVVTLPDGRARLLYSFGSAVRMATCVDVACSATEVVDLFDTDPWMVNGMSAAVRGDGSPVFVISVWDPAAPEEGVLEGQKPGFEHRLVWCADPGCASLEAITLPHRIHGDPVVVSDPDGRVAVFDLMYVEPAGGDWPEPDRVLGFRYCDGPTCLDDPTGWVELVAFPFDEMMGMGVDAPRGGFDRDGRPVAVYHLGGGSPADELSGLHLVRCTTPECTAVTEPRLLVSGYEFIEPRPPLLRNDGALIEISQAMVGEMDEGEILITVCEGPDPDEVNSTVVFRNEEGGSCCFDGAVGLDGMPIAVWSTGEGVGITRCTDPGCAGFEPPVLIPVRAPHAQVLTAADGATLLITMDKRTSGSNIYTGLWVLRCTGATCVQPSGDIALFD